MSDDRKKPGRDVFRIIYPSGDRTKLKVADIWSYEADEYDLASQREFYDEDEANEYCIALAAKHGLKYDGGDGKHAFLD